MIKIYSCLPECICFPLLLWPPQARTTSETACILLPSQFECQVTCIHLQTGWGPMPLEISIGLALDWVSEPSAVSSGM